MVLTNADIASVDAQIRGKYPQYTTYVHGDTFQVNGTVAASAAANSPQAASVVVDGSVATVQQVPQSQVWLFTDLYNRTTTDTPTDSTAQFIKNGVKTIATTAPLSTQLTTNQTRPGLPAPFYYEPNSRLTVNVIPIAAAATTTTTDTFFINVTIYDASFGGNS